MIAEVTDAPVGQPRALTFEERYPATLEWVEKRRRSIDLAQTSWDDIRQMVLIRVSQQYHLYDPSRDYGHWVNRVISNALRNIWRDNYAIAARPCVTGKGGCSENMGGNLCRRTPSGTQCSECPAYRDWERRKGSQYAIMQPLPLDVPMEGDSKDMPRQEASNGMAAFVDMEEKVGELHAAMKKRLSREEWRIYRMLVIRGMEAKDVAKALGFRKKKGSKSRTFPGYLVLLSARHKFEEIAREEAEKLMMAA